jgi:folylpolyglutamate synthase/dihydropteroate synthase
VADAFERAGARVTLLPEAREALDAALGEGGGRPVLVTGSFYLLGEVRGHLRTAVDAGPDDFV